jgi:hypothetical protein
MAVVRAVAGFAVLAGLLTIIVPIAADASPSSS